MNPVPKLNPKHETMVNFLEGHGHSIPTSDVLTLSWQDIDRTKMPVVLIQNTDETNANCWVLLNREAWETYRKPRIDDLVRTFYIVPIDDLMKVSDLPEMEANIEKDRIFEKTVGRKFVDIAVKEACMTMIATELHRTKTSRAIAQHFAIPIHSVIGWANELKKRVPGLIPEAIKGEQYDVFIRNLRLTKPELFPDIPKKVEPIPAKVETLVFSKPVHLEPAPAANGKKETIKSRLLACIESYGPIHTKGIAEETGLDVRQVQNNLSSEASKNRSLKHTADGWVYR